MPKRPLTITLVALLFLVTGAVTFGFHLSWSWGRGVIHYDLLLVLSICLLTLVAGAFMLRRNNWAHGWLWPGWHSTS